MPCFIRRTKIVDASGAWASIGSSVANTGMPAFRSSRSRRSASYMSRPDRSMFSQMTAANGGRSMVMAARSWAMPPSRGMLAAANCSHRSVRERSSRSVPPLSMSQYQREM